MVTRNPNRPRAAPSWIAFRKPQPQARLRLFCFPYAGGGASIYRGWQDDLPPQIEVCPVQLPGRENRLSEERFRQVAPLTEALVGQIGEWLDMPFALFGHSLGAIIAYETAQRLRTDLGKNPVHLIVSARRAPGVPSDRDPMYDLPPAEFRERLKELEGTPAEVLEHPELMDLMEPLLRADFELNDAYEPTDLPPLGCPMTALGGLEDKDVEREHLAPWQKFTTGPFRLRMFPGGHFFLNEGRLRASLLSAVAQDLAHHLGS